MAKKEIIIMRIDIIKLLGVIEAQEEEIQEEEIEDIITKGIMIE